MKLIFKIAKAEIKQLFYSPIAWFLLIVFFVQCSLAYTEVLDGFARRQEMGGPAMTSMKELTNMIFGKQWGIFSSVLNNLFLYVPLLTMGLISRETSSGTIKLLYSSPVTVPQIVLGKYVSMLLYSLCMLAILALLMIVGYFNIQSADIPLMLTTLLGIYLLLCAYSAIGLFMSSLTTYQVLAGIGTFVIIGFLSYVGNLWQRYDFVRDLTYFLSLTGRTENMLSGLISTRDILYFGIIIYIFLSFTIVRMKSTRESMKGYVKAGWYAGVLISALMLGYVTSRPYLVGYADATAVKSQSLSPQVREIIEKLGDAPLEVTSYSNLLGSQYQLGLPEMRNKYLTLWEPYVRYKPDISFKYFSYYDSAYDTNPMMTVMRAPGTPPQSIRQQAEERAKNYDYTINDYLTPEQMYKTIDLRPELTRFVMQLKYKNQSTFLRVYDDMVAFPAEPEVAAAFNRLLQAKFPRIVFLTGNLERSPYKNGEREYKYLVSEKGFRHAFINQGFDVDSVSLDNSDVPANASVLVIADPRRELSPTAQARLDAYIRRGGNLLIAGEPGKQEIINPIIRQLGVQLMEGIIAQPDFQHTPDIVYSKLSGESVMLHQELKSKIRNDASVIMPGATGLMFTADSGFQFKPLLTNRADVSWLKKDKMVVDSAEVKFDAAAGDEKRIFPLALALTRQINGKEQRIIVTGDADFLSNQSSTMHLPQAANFVYNTGMFSWLSYGEYPILANRPESKDKLLNISSDGVKSLKIVLGYVLPGLLLLIASVLLLRRKRK